jgi:hypothetical protein
MVSRTATGGRTQSVEEMIRRDSQLILKRASASRPSGQWNDDDYANRESFRFQPQQGSKNTIIKSAGLIQRRCLASRTLVNRDHDVLCTKNGI